MPMYSLAIAHDNADGNFLMFSISMLVANGIGSTVGPLIYVGFNVIGSHDVYFVIIAAVYSIGAAWTAYRISLHDVDRTFF